MAGIGADIKTLKLTTGKVTSTSAVAYTQYNNKLLTIKGKAIYGQNLTDQLMIGGYGVSKINSVTSDTTYTNFNTASGWVNITYGSKFQVGILGGYSKNLGTTDQLTTNLAGKYMAYGYGFTAKTQTLIDGVWRIAPTVTYSLGDFKLSLEYDYTTAAYGNVLSSGKTENTSNISNHRLLASLNYTF